MYSYENRVGRLVEVRLSSPLSREETVEFASVSRSFMASHRRPVISCVDMLGLTVLEHGVEAELAATLRGANPWIERTACLLPTENATLYFQIEQLHRAAGNLARQTFRTADDVEHWLADVLTPAERARLREFLGIASGSLPPPPRLTW